MAQVSYGTITITDTTDIERIYTVYAKSANNTTVPSIAKESWSENVSTAPGSGNYIWQRTVVEKSGTGDKTYSDPVCLTGEEGTDATEISNIEVRYGISADWNTQPTSWSVDTPAYDSSKPKYWTRTRLAYDTNPTTYSDPIYTKDEALTKAVADAAIANSVAQHANEDAQGAMSQAAAAQYATEALAAKVKHYWWDSTGAHIASGINGADVTEGTASTYGFNSLVGLASMTFGYNSYKTVELDGSIPALKFYKPSKTAQGDLTATLNSNGLVLSEGGIKAGNYTTSPNKFIYLSTEDYNDSPTITINGNSSNWRQIIGTKFGVKNDGTLYASNAFISGTLTIGANSTINGTSASTVVDNASTGASAASDLAIYKETVSSTYATKSAAIAEEQLIYIQATSGTNSVNAYPSSSTTTSSYWVTQTGESIPNGTPPDSATGQTPRWTTKRPSYQKNYPVIFVAKQKKTVSGAITCTTPIKDDTTTIIDGGHITTGTIDASKITVTNLQASSIAVGSSNVAAALDTKASNSAEYEVVVKVNSINYTTPSATLIAIPTKLGASTTGSFVWYKNAIGTAHEGTVSTTTNTNDTLTVTDLNALYIAVLQ